MLRFALIRPITQPNRIAALDGYELRFDAPFFKEFVVRTTRGVDKVLEACRERGILGGVPMARFVRSLDDCFLVRGYGRKRTRAEIDALIEALEGA